MHPIRLTLLFAALNLVGSNAEPLRVLRVTPQSPADPFDVITVTFDRPVAGGLDVGVAPEQIFRIAPAVDGKVEWRDPVSLRFTPNDALRAGASYTITIEPSFEAMDGSRLPRAFEFTFRIAGARVLGGQPANAHEEPHHLTADPVFSILLSSPADQAALARGSSIVMDRACGSQSIGLRALRQRRIEPEDLSYFRYTGYRGRRQPGDSLDLRRIIELTPASPLPLGCVATLFVPVEVGASDDALHRWRFRTHGPLRLTAATCVHDRACPTGPIRAQFSTPVRGSDVLRRVRIAPNVPFTVRDTTAEAATWVLDAKLSPRGYYAVVIDSALTDVFGQRFTGVAVRPVRTTGYAPAVAYDYGRMLVERDGLRTLAVQHVNVDTLLVTTYPVPDSLEADFLSRSWNWDEPLAQLRGSAARQRVAVGGGPDEQRVTGIRLPASGAPFAVATGQPVAAQTATGQAVVRPTLLAVQITSAQLDSSSRMTRPVALVQVTDLGIHARIGQDQGAVWVTGAGDGKPRGGAHVTLYDANGRTRASARTDTDGIAKLENFRTYPDSSECGDECGNGFEGYVAAALADDRALVGLNAWDPDLAPWRFGIHGAWGESRAPVAAAVFTERGIYRPGETVHAKAIVRRGPLGALLPARADSARWLFEDREGGVLEDTAVALSAFGTADHAVALSTELALGYYGIQLQLRLEGEWKSIAWANYQVAEYRPPEFLVEMTGDATPRFGGDSASVHVSARYLFGAPMAHAPVQWVLRLAPQPWGVAIPGTEAFQVGGVANWWEDGDDEEMVRGVAQGVDTLDARGQLDVSVALPSPWNGRPASATVQALVTEANRQTVAAATSFTVHPASFYIGARARGDHWFWSAGQPVTLEAITVRPDGERVMDIAVTGVVVRREWHRVRRTRNGQVQEVGSWVSDTVASCALRTRNEPVSCSFTPTRGGSYRVTFTATDEAGRAVISSFSRWAAGEDWVPWNDDSQIKMDVIPDRQRYTVGDTATVLFASPFTDAEAWVTIERERVLESHRLRLTSGATTLRFPITEAFAPNAFVSIVVVRGRSAAPGPLDDPGRPTLRVGYAELRVTPEVKRLTVEVDPLGGDGTSSSQARENGTSSSSRATAAMVDYRPGDTARIQLRVRDAVGAPQRAEVTLWAVDEGVLALTGYRTPDPVDLIYATRGLGMRLASNLVAVAPQIPEGQKGRREPGGGGGGDLAGVLRSRFQTTAFFLASVVTNEAGVAIASARLPDNLTTFRVMAVAVTAGDRYGSGESRFLVTRPLIARPALPRFVRPGDRFSAGPVVNHRMGGTPRVEVEATSEGVRLEGSRKKKETLAAGRGTDVRFDFRAPVERDAGRVLAGLDSARFRFVARSEKEADGVELRLPVRPDFHPLASTVAGVLRDTAAAEFIMEGDVDAARSWLTISFGTSPLAIISGARRDLQIYPYYCTEQLASVALPLIALHRAERELGGNWLVGDPEVQIRRAVQLLVRRQNPDGGFGYWSATHWGTPTLSAYVGRVLLEANEVGVEVEEKVLSNLADYLARSLQEEWEPRVAVAWWYGDQSARLSERLAAAEFLSRYGRPHVPTENVLLANAARLRWEDRLLLAELLARRDQLPAARDLVNRALATAAPAGRVLDLPREAYAEHYFRSIVRPVARLLTALIAADPTHQMVAPLVETLVQQGRARASETWNTQDYAHAVLALMRVEALQRGAGDATVTVKSGNRTVLATTTARTAPRDTSTSLDRIVSRNADGQPVVRLQLQAPPAQAPVYYFLTVHEVPKERQRNPIDRGIQVERWYETVDSRRPTVTALEGDLIRVRLRITVPAERHFVVVDDPLPAGLEAVDLSLRTVSPFRYDEALGQDPRDVIRSESNGGWYYGSWDAGMWSPFDHKELRDDRVVYSATVLWPGTYSATYLARATTAGTFVVPPAHAEEMYNPGVNGRTGGSEFTVSKPIR